MLGLEFFRHEKKRNYSSDISSSIPSCLLIIAVIAAASQSHAVAPAVSPLAPGIALALCHRIGGRIEWLRLGIWVGDGSGHGLRFWFRHEAVAPAIDPGAILALLALLLLRVFKAPAVALAVYPVTGGILLAFLFLRDGWHGAQTLAIYPVAVRFALTLFFRAGLWRIGFAIIGSRIDVDHHGIAVSGVGRDDAAVPSECICVVPDVVVARLTTPILYPKM